MIKYQIYHLYGIDTDILLIKGLWNLFCRMKSMVLVSAILNTHPWLKLLIRCCGPRGL